MKGEVPLRVSAPSFCSISAETYFWLYTAKMATSKQFEFFILVIINFKKQQQQLIYALVCTCIIIKRKRKLTQTTNN